MGGAEFTQKDFKNGPKMVKKFSNLHLKPILYGFESSSFWGKLFKILFPK